jgi:hypothetical protein
LIERHDVAAGMFTDAETCMQSVGRLCKSLDRTGSETYTCLQDVARWEKKLWMNIHSTIRFALVESMECERTVVSFVPRNVNCAQAALGRRITLDE